MLPATFARRDYPVHNHAFRADNSPPHAGPTASRSIVHMAIRNGYTRPCLESLPFLSSVSPYRSLNRYPVVPARPTLPRFFERGSEHGFVPGGQIQVFGGEQFNPAFPAGINRRITASLEYVFHGSLSVPLSSHPRILCICYFPFQIVGTLPCHVYSHQRHSFMDDKVQTHSDRSVDKPEELVPQITIEADVSYSMFEFDETVEFKRTGELKEYSDWLRA